jgi:hypothetical protein
MTELYGYLGDEPVELFVADTGAVTGLPSALVSWLSTILAEGLTYVRRGPSEKLVTVSDPEALAWWLMDQGVDEVTTQPPLDDLPSEYPPELGE